MSIEKLTPYEKTVARRCGISAADIACHGRNECGAVYSLYNRWFYISGTFDGYSKPQVYRALLRQFIERAERAAGY